MLSAANDESSDYDNLRHLRELHVHSSADSAVTTRDTPMRRRVQFTSVLLSADDDATGFYHASAAFGSYEYPSNLRGLYVHSSACSAITTKRTPMRRHVQFTSVLP